MQTRRKKDLSNIDIKDLMLNENNICNIDVNTLNSLPPTILENNLLKKDVNNYSDDDEEEDDYNTISWFLIDVEAYSLDKLPNISEGGLSVIPVQIAWSICTYRLGKTPKIIRQDKKMFYVSESLLLSKYRNLLNSFSSFFTPATAQKHEQNMISSKFPVVPAKDILKEMEIDLKKCDFITAFNMSWDIEAVNNLCRIATTSAKSTSAISNTTSATTSATSNIEIMKNPISLPRNIKKHIDLMVLSYKIFWNELHTNTNNNGSGSGIYTVANMHKILCEKENDIVQKQRHLAEYDLDMETEILSTILSKFQDADDFEEYVEKRKKNGNLTIPFWNKKKRDSTQMPEKLI